MKRAKTKTKRKEPSEGSVEPDAVRTEAGESTESSAAGSSTGADADSAADDKPRDELTELREKVVKLDDSLLRARAEYQNFQRRAAISQSEAIRYANAGLLKSLLGVLDDFERSMSSSSGEDNDVDEGVRLVYENLQKALREHGLETIDAVGKQFDPSIHEAMMQQPSSTHPPGTVLEEFAKGYRLGDRVLRPSKVIVSKSVGDKQGGESSDGEESSVGEGSTVDDGTPVDDAAPVVEEQATRHGEKQPQQ